MKNLKEEYSNIFQNTLNPLSKRLETFLCDIFCDIPRIDRIITRPKSINRFLDKAAKEENSKKKYTDPLNQIQDQLGARIITFYPDDVSTIAEEIENYFHPIEDQTIVPDSDSEFGYFGKHYILLIPKDVIKTSEPKIPPFFELQIKTLFQHAWSEANHDLGYKSEVDLTSNIKRKLAFTSAQAWGADQIFNDLQKEISSLVAQNSVEKCEKQ
ncbi:MAG: hypothetical protein DRJ01_08205 [Bacteroidetes bacterium]|nr:MAG: hypothetical protein DRJ01_08205 [Bacteroidota bacterium]